VAGAEATALIRERARAPGSSRHDKLRPREDLALPAPAELAGLDDAGFRAKFAGSPTKRIGRNRFIRNVAVANDDTDDPALRAAAADPDPVSAESAHGACARLPNDGRIADGGNPAHAGHPASRAGESG